MNNEDKVRQELRTERACHKLNVEIGNRVIEELKARITQLQLELEDERSKAQLKSQELSRKEEVIHVLNDVLDGFRIIRKIDANKYGGNTSTDILGVQQLVSLKLEPEVAKVLQLIARDE